MMDALQSLEEDVQRAFRSGDAGHLDVLGYGEISSVLGLDTGGKRYACKRLPTMSEQQAAAYEDCLERYLHALSSAGIHPLESTLHTFPADGGFAPWCVQPRLREEELLPVYLGNCDEDEAAAVISPLVQSIAHAVTPELGLDSQVSNWACVDGRLVYLDITTPLMREDGRELLDTSMFIASLPWLLRKPVQRFLLKEILDTYYRPRGALLDAAANLHKERLGYLLPTFLEEANAHVTPLRAEEVERFYRQDAVMWSALQTTRRVDRFWQLRVRKRAYPFLLPGRIVR